DTIGFQPPTKSAAEEMIVDYDLAYWQSGGARRRSLSARDSLGTDPHLTAVLADVDRAVHRLQRGVRKERELVNRIGSGDRRGHRDVGVTDVLCHRTRTERCLFKFSRDRSGGEVTVWPVLPLDLECLQAFSRRAHMVSHNRDRIVKPDYLMYAL